MQDMNSIYKMQDKCLMISGDSDDTLKAAIHLASHIEYITNGKRAEAWAFHPSIGLTFYWYNGSGHGLKFPVALDHEGMYNVAREWLKQPDAERIRDRISPEAGCMDGTYCRGWVVNTSADVPGKYDAILTITPTRIYYGK
jgi:hypothetical protein